MLSILVVIELKLVVYLASYDDLKFWMQKMFWFDSLYSLSFRPDYCSIRVVLDESFPMMYILPISGKKIGACYCSSTVFTKKTVETTTDRRACTVSRVFWFSPLNSLFARY